MRIIFYAPHCKALQHTVCTPHPLPLPLKRLEGWFVLTAFNCKCKLGLSQSSQVIIKYAVQSAGVNAHHSPVDCDQRKTYLIMFLFFCFSSRNYYCHLKKILYTANWNKYCCICSIGNKVICSWWEKKRRRYGFLWLLCILLHWSERQRGGVGRNIPVTCPQLTCTL